MSFGIPVGKFSNDTHYTRSQVFSREGDQYTLVAYLSTGAVKERLNFRLNRGCNLAQEETTHATLAKHIMEIYFIENVPGQLAAEVQFLTHDRPQPQDSMKNLHITWQLDPEEPMVLVKVCIR